MIKQFQKGPSYWDPRQGSSGFDPRVSAKFNNADGGGAASTLAQAKPGQKMQVNITLTNNTAQLITFELWYWLNSFMRVQNPQYAVGNYTYIPQDSYEGIKAIAAATDQTVGRDKAGNVVIRGLLADPVATIACKEIAYGSFFEASSITPFSVAWIRMTVTTDPQIDNVINWIKKSYSGGVVTNPISPRSFFQPNQFQPKTVDILASFDIKNDTGLTTQLLAAEKVSYALFINIWTEQNQ